MSTDRARWKDLALSLGVTTGYGLPLGLATIAVWGIASVDDMSGPGLVALILVLLGMLAAWIVGTRAAYRHARAGRRAGLSAAWAAFVLVVFVAWGLIVDGMSSATCEVGRCVLFEVQRPLAMPEVFGLLTLHAAVALAFMVSRRRAEALHPWAEVAVNATLVAGMVMHAMIAVQLVDLVPNAFLTLGVGLPALAPFVTLALLGSELYDRLRRGGAEAVVSSAAAPAEKLVYGGVGLPPDAAPVRGAIHVPTLVRAVAASPLILGAHAVVQGLWLHETAGALRVFTHTCGHALSTLPIHHVPRNCGTWML